MAKYVCDVEQVIAEAEKLISMATDLKTGVSNYAGTVTSDLSSWDGTSKNTFTRQCEGQVEFAQSNAEEAQKIGEFVKASAQAIQSLEEELSTLTI